MAAASPTAKSLLRLPSVGDALLSMAVSPDGRRLWLAHSADPLRPAHEFIGDSGKLFVSCWDLEAGKSLGGMETEPVEYPALVAVGNTERVLIAHQDGGLLVDLESGQESAFPLLKRDVLYGPPHIDSAGTLATVYVRREGESALVRVDLNTGRVALTISPVQGPFALSSDGKWLCHLVEVDRQRSLRIVRAQDGALEAECPAHASLSMVKAFAIDEWGRTVAWHASNKIGIWRVGTDPVTRPVMGFGVTDPPALAFDLSSRMLYSMTYGSVGIFHAIDTEQSVPVPELSEYDMDYGEGEAAGEILGQVGMVALTNPGTIALAATPEGLSHYELSAGFAVRSIVAGPMIDDDRRAAPT